MFTGLIETIGILKNSRTQSGGKVLTISGHFEGESLRVGESIAVDGLCLTVEGFNSTDFTCTASAETLARGTIGGKRAGSKVHLERALRLGDRLGGHMVQGHVDGVGTIQQNILRGTGAEVAIDIPFDLQSYVVEKGSLAVQGVSLTVARLESGLAWIAVIPETLRRTYLRELHSGDQVNLEVDILAKYVDSLLHKKSGLNEGKLKEWGFE
jgi:riboflavin synthase